MPNASKAAPPDHAISSAGSRSLRWVWAVVAAVAGAWFLTLGARHLLPFDEGRYAEIAREMLVSGDWVTIHYNGLKYFEKPPLHLWMTALAYHAFGIGDWQARLWVAVSGAVGLLVTILAARRWFGPRAAMLSGLVLLATPSWNIGAHFNSLDMSVSGALACVLSGLLMAQHPQTAPKTRRAWMWFAWAAMGLAVLTKGLIGIVLPGLVLVVYTLLARDWGVWRQLHILSGTMLMLAIAAPWFVLVSIRNPEFPQFFFIHEHWQRYTTTIHQRGAPVWYFVPQLLGGFLPWLGLSSRIVSVVRQDTARVARFKPMLFLAVWAGSIFVFFSLSNSKLPGYIMPIFPALALLAAPALAEMDGPAWRRQILWMLSVTVIGLLASPMIGRLESHNATNAQFRSYALWVAGACLIAIAGILVALYLNRVGRMLGSVTAFSLSVFAATTVGLVGHETFGRSGSGVDLVAPIQAALTPSMPIYSVRWLDHTLPFYLERTMIMVEAPGELEFGVRQEPQKWIPTLGRFLQEWSSGQHALAVMSHDTYESLRREGVPMFPVAQDRRRIVVANFPRASP